MGEAAGDMFYRLGMMYSVGGEVPADYVTARQVVQPRVHARQYRRRAPAPGDRRRDDRSRDRGCAARRARLAAALSARPGARLGVAAQHKAPAAHLHQGRGAARPSHGTIQKQQPAGDRDRVVLQFPTSRKWEEHMRVSIRLREHIGARPSRVGAFTDAQRWCGSLRCHCRVLQCNDVPRGTPSPASKRASGCAWRRRRCLCADCVLETCVAIRAAGSSRGLCSPQPTNGKKYGDEWKPSSIDPESKTAHRRHVNRRHAIGIVIMFLVSRAALVAVRPRDQALAGRTTSVSGRSGRSVRAMGCRRSISASPSTAMPTRTAARNPERHPTLSLRSFRCSA